MKTIWYWHFQRVCDMLLLSTWTASYSLSWLATPYSLYHRRLFLDILTVSTYTILPSIAGGLVLSISALSSVIMIYASIVIGQLFTNHRVLGSVICYIGLTTLLSIISYALLFALGLVSLKVTDTSMSMQYFSTVSYMVKTLNLSMILALVTSVILYTITYQLMRVKLNLN